MKKERKFDMMSGMLELEQGAEEIHKKNIKPTLAGQKKFHQGSKIKAKSWKRVRNKATRLGGVKVGS